MENVGPGAAYNVRLTTDREFSADGNVHLTKLGLFRHTLGFFASRQRIEHLLASMMEAWDELMREPLEITATYSDGQGRPYQRTFVINFAAFENLTRIGKQPLYSVADDLERIQKDLHQLATGSYKVHVLTEPLEQYRGRQRAEHIYYLLRQLSEEEQAELTEDLHARVKRRSQASAEKAHNPDAAPRG